MGATDSLTLAFLFGIIGAVAVGTLALARWVLKTRNDGSRSRLSGRQLLWAVLMASSRAACLGCLLVVAGQLKVGKGISRDLAKRSNQQAVMLVHGGVVVALMGLAFAVRWLGRGGEKRGSPSPSSPPPPCP